jgi:hypothetical protein
MVQVPAAAKVAVLPETVQTPVVDDAKLTANPELAVALKVSGVPTVCVAIAPRVIVCGFSVTLKLCVTEGAVE